MNSKTTQSERVQAGLCFEVFTLFPEMFASPFEHSMIQRAREKGLIELRLHQIRDWTQDKHKSTDDYAYGGGGGMVMKAGPVFRALEDVLEIPELSADSVADYLPPCPIIMLTPQGRPFDHAMAQSFAKHERLAFLCGHYEGFDERIRQHLVTHEVSIGDFVLTGGELPAMLMIDAISRLREGVLGLDGAAESDSLACGGLEHPHYTRPADFRGWKVPEVLLSGNHAAIDQWRSEQSEARTRARRADLLDEPASEDED